MPSFLATSHSNQLPSKLLVNPTTEAIFLGQDGNALVCPIEGSLVLQTPGNARRFKLSIAGYGTSTGANNLVIKVYLGTSATVASDGTAILSSGNIAMNSTNQNWFINVELVFDSQSKQIGGIFYGFGAAALIDLTAITMTSTGSFSDVAEGQGFVVSATCANVSSHVLTTFELIPD